MDKSPSATEDRPLVSVVLPTFNTGALIEETIESVLAQTFRSYEIIVVDDGSTDGTESRLQQYTALPNFTYIHQRNQGAAAARNRGVRQARGDYVAFLDADDLWLPDKLSHQVALMQFEPELGLVCSDYEYFDSAGIITPSGQDLHRLAGRRSLFRPLVRRLFILTSTTMVRRSVLDTLAGFDETLRWAEERDLFIRIARAYAIAVLPLVLVRYRRHAGNATNKLEKDLLPWDLVVYERFRHGAIPLSPEERTDVEAFLVGRYRRLTRYNLRMGNGATARKLLHGLFRLRPLDMFMTLYPLAYLPGPVLRRLHGLKAVLWTTQKDS